MSNTQFNFGELFGTFVVIGIVVIVIGLPLYYGLAKLISK